MVRRAYQQRSLIEVLLPDADKLSFKKIEKHLRRESNFYLTMRDGQQQPLFPERQAAGAGSTPAATSAEDELTLGPRAGVRRRQAPGVNPGRPALGLAQTERDSPSGA
jgi:hypothetical protein